MLLHLGGQETITAFSMEDCALWKRHLLTLTVQVLMAIYVVSKQWRGDKRLAAPTAIMFVAGMTRYAERIWALRRAQSTSLESSDMEFYAPTAEFHFNRHSTAYYDKLDSIISDEQERNSERIVEVATKGFRLGLDFLMDVIPPRPAYWYYGGIELWGGTREPSDSLVDMAYKLADIHLSMIYDYFYTKFGGGLVGLLCRITTLALNCIALSLFLVSRLDHHLKAEISYNIADVMISYILLVGAITLEISSVLLWLMSSYSTWDLLRKHLHRESSRIEWSGELQQYNMIDECIHEKQAGRQLERVMRRVGIERACSTKPVKVSADVKRLILDKMLKIWATSTSANKLDLTRFHGEWAQRWVKRYYHHEAPPPFEFTAGTSDEEQASAASPSARAQRALGISRIQDLGFVASVFIWHLVTDICLEADSTSVADSTGELISSSWELSNYVMYLVVKRKAMVSKYERDSLSYSREQVMWPVILDRPVDRRWFVRNLRFERHHDMLGDATDVSSELLKMEEAAARWDLIATVWVEMICYMAHNCGVTFHAKQLCAGGELVTHVKMLLMILRFPV
uniref:DUF4220 domain-containing protein n=1 Tax=Oryza punctata TaxID=4537 RepID=A0A0E0MHR6_ORYPU